jgi:hypothetical protein
MANGNQRVSGTSEQRQRNLDHDEPTGDSPRGAPGSNSGGTVVHVELEDSRPAAVTLPSEQDPELADGVQDLGSEFLF